jgi:hypothetical protein
LEERTVAAFDELYDSQPTDAEGVATLAELADAIDTLRNERERRTQVREEATARATELHSRVHASNDEGDGAGDGAGGEGDGTETPPTPTPQEQEQETRQPESVAAGGALPPPTPNVRVRQAQRINVPLSEIRARAPEPADDQRLSIVAAADVPRWQAGHNFQNVGELADAFHERAKLTPILASGNVSGPKVATIRREYKHVVDRDTPPSAIEAMMKDITNPQSLVAAGGWCAPSEISYSFFDITCEDGLIDLPEFGVSRGGLRYPISPSLADVFTGTFTNATNPWLWTESDDILTITGSTNKPCVRVPCPTFDEKRLECYGICLTAGNLTDNAYPEATEHQLGLLQSANYHAQNQRYIAVIAALSTSVTATGIGIGGSAISSDLPTYIEWAATDYRIRFGMCESDILEVVLPTWVKAVIRADLSLRQGGGVDELSVTDAEIDNFFDVRKVRVQYVKDWQVRGVNQPGGATPTSIFPLTVSFMMYAAGTWGRGNGMTLDLGVVRDSVLNAENDHTAAWTEECHLIAMFGHASRVYTVGICAGGKTGLATVDDCRTTAA